jgi:dihydroorotase-like cyclic amidohydrolase
MRFDMLIRGGTVVSASGRGPADIGIQDGRIAALLEPDTPAEAERTIDAAGKHLLPGIIDVHSHHR